MFWLCQCTWQIQCAWRAFLTSVDFRVAIIFNYSRWKTTQNLNSNPPFSQKSPLLPVTTALLFPLANAPKVGSMLPWCSCFPMGSLPLSQLLFHVYYKKTLSHFRTFRESLLLVWRKALPLPHRHTCCFLPNFSHYLDQNRRKMRQNICTNRQG